MNTPIRISRFITIIALLISVIVPSGLGIAADNSPVDTGSPNVPAPLQDTYIIVFRGSVNAAAAIPEMARAHGLTVLHQYRYGLRGMAAVVPAGRVNALRNDPRVAYVEQDQMAYAFQDPVPTGIDRLDAEPGITRKSQFSGNYSNVGVAVIDSGVASHPDLNIVFRTDCTSGTCIDGTSNDQNGHGTHVAGTIAADGGIVGVAPGAPIYGVRVLDSAGSGQISWIVAGIDRVTQLGLEGRVKVANMSLGCECFSQAMNDAISASVNAGVTYVVAAGNSAKNASTFSPANHPAVVTVSAIADFDGQPGGLGSPTCRSDVDDTLADFSNYGSMVEVAAPGVCILSTWNNGGYNTISGTSMASPHVAGAAVLVVASGITNPSQVRSTLINTGVVDWSDEKDGVAEPRVDVGESGGSGTGSVHVGDLDGSRILRNGNRWEARVTVTVHNNNEQPVAGATVTVSFSGAVSGTVTGTTGSNGTVVVSSGNIRGGSSVTVTVTNVSGSYNASANHDPDGDSNGTSITVNK